MLWRWRQVALPEPLPPPPCVVPGCDRPAITGDGPGTPCWRCLFRFGHSAADPEHLTDGEVVLLLEAHGDRIELVRTHSGGQRWFWKPDEPGETEVVA